MKILFTPEYEVKQELLKRLRNTPPENLNSAKMYLETLIALKDTANILYIDDSTDKEAGDDC